MTSPDKSSLLTTVADASTGFDKAREALHQAVRKAVDGGATWSEVGNVLGVSRQAAFQRFGRKQAAPREERHSEVSSPSPT